jgi:hypothetical protein
MNADTGACSRPLPDDQVGLVVEAFRTLTEVRSATTRPQSDGRDLVAMQPDADLEAVSPGWTPAAARREVGVRRSESGNRRNGHDVGLSPMR